MYLLVKVLVIVLVCRQVQSQIFEQQLTIPRPFGGELRKLLRIPDIKFPILHRIITDIQQPWEKMTTRTNFQMIATTEKASTTTFLPQIVKKHGEFQETKTDCSDLVDISCEEQRKLIANVFFDKVDIKSRSMFEPNQLEDELADKNETTSTTSEYETTTFDDELAQRIDPGLLASLVGR